MTARLWLEARDKNNEFSEYVGRSENCNNLCSSRASASRFTFSFPFVAEGDDKTIGSHEDQ
jgi:hypothetical protein